MLRIKRKIVQDLIDNPVLELLQAALATAVQLELSTIPPYLTGLFSLQDNSNQEAAALVQSVVTEEMLHMTLAANTLIAIGGNPDIVALGNALQYPGALPDKIDDDLQVSLAALSLNQVQSVFMAIEKPDYEGILPGETKPNPPPHNPGEFASIGDFYEAVLIALSVINEVDKNLFANPRAEQQVDISVWFPPVATAPAKGKIIDLASAKQAIKTIIAQGEGTNFQHGPYLPTDGDGSYAHYFKFGEIYYGNRLVKDEKAVSGWSYTGEPVALNTSAIYNFLPNAALSDYAPGSGAFVAGQRFYQTYQMLLGSLNTVFNGNPEALRSALGLMYQLKLQAQQVAQYPAKSGDPSVVAAPPFMLSHPS